MQAIAVSEVAVSAGGLLLWLGEGEAQNSPFAALFGKGTMARIRTVKPELFKHEGLFDLEQELGAPVRLIWAGLFTACDREGRFKWRPRSIKADVFPFDTFDLSRVLDALATRGFLVRYACGREEFGCIPSWKSHQFINNKEPQSGIPQPPQNVIVDASVTREPRVDHACGTRGVKEGKGMEGNGKVTERRVSDLSEFVLAIACAHPRALQKSWGPLDVPQNDSSHILDAIHAESVQAGCSPGEAAQMILDRVTYLAQKIPKGEWRYLKPPGEFMRLRDYRLEPESFSREQGGRNGTETKWEAAHRRIREEAMAEDEADDDGGVAGSADTVS